jgi:hypothetical protein
MYLSEATSKYSHQDFNKEDLHYGYQVPGENLRYYFSLEISELQGNMKLTKILLFKCYCMSFYACALWFAYMTRTMDTFYESYNQSHRILMAPPSYCSAKQMFIYLGIYSRQEIMRQIIYRLHTRVQSDIDSCIQGTFYT